MNVFDFDNKLRKKHGEHIIGVDECGRGAVAGPLCAGAVMFAPDTRIVAVKDSKQLDEKSREELYELITEQAIAWHVAFISAEDVDKMGITKANCAAMEEAIREVERKSGIKANLYVVDQSPLKIANMLMMPKADSLSASVAAGSIIAKVAHDRHMAELAKQYPNYNLEVNKGYGNPDHIELIKKHGKAEGLHRMSFKIKALSPYKQVRIEDLFN